MRQLLRGIATLVTLRGPERPRVGAEMRELGVVRNGAMLVEGTRLVAVGEEEDVARQAKDAEIVDLDARVVLPGLVDAHAHPVFGGNRVAEFEMRAEGATYREIAERGGGIRSTVAATRAAGEDALLEQAWRRMGWFLSCGTTTLEAKSGYGLTTDDELKMLRVIRRLNKKGPMQLVPTFLGAHAVPADCEDRGAYVERVVGDMLPKVATEGLAEYADAFCESGYFDVEAARSVLLAAKSHGLGIRLHADQLSRCGGAQLAAEVGARTADHLEQTDTEGIEALMAAGVQPVLLPGSVYALGLQRYPLARDMIDAGLPVVLATDFNPGSSPTPSLPMVMSLACTHMHMTPAEAIVATTINAAYSLDRGEDRGSLEAGKLADFVVLDVDDPREVAYWFGVGLVRETWIGGRLVWSAS